MVRLVDGQFVRRSLSFLDVAATSALTLTLTFSASRFLGVNEFGVFGIAQTLIGIVVAVYQGGLFDPQLRDSEGLSSDAFWISERFYPAAVGVGLLAFLALLFLPSLGSPVAVGLIVALVAAEVFLFVRMYWVRAYLVKSGNTVRSLVVSVANLSLALIAAIWLVRDGAQGWLPLLGLHLLATGATGIIGFRIIGGQRSGGSGRQGWNFAYAGESIVLLTVTQLSSVVAAPRLGLAFNAGLRGASTVMGPLNVVFGGAQLTLLPRMVRSERPGRLLAVTAAVLALPALVWFLVLYLVLQEFGPHLLGASLGVVMRVLPLVSITYVTYGIYLAAFLCARARRFDRAVRSARVFNVVVVAAATAVAMITTDWWIYVLGNSVAHIGMLIWVILALRAAPKGQGDAEPTEVAVTSPRAARPTPLRTGLPESYAETGCGPLQGRTQSCSGSGPSDGEGEWSR